MFRRAMSVLLPTLRRRDPRIEELERAVRELQQDKDRMPALLHAAMADELRGTLLAQEQLAASRLDAAVELGLAEMTAMFGARLEAVASASEERAMVLAAAEASAAARSACEHADELHRRLQRSLEAQIGAVVKAQARLQRPADAHPATSVAPAERMQKDLRAVRSEPVPR